jgi:hypothetical protein
MNCREKSFPFRTLSPVPALKHGLLAGKMISVTTPILICISLPPDVSKEASGTLEGEASMDSVLTTYGICLWSERRLALHAFTGISKISSVGQRMDLKREATRRVVSCGAYNRISLHIISQPHISNPSVNKCATPGLPS